MQRELSEWLLRNGIDPSTVPDPPPPPSGLMVEYDSEEAYLEAVERGEVGRHGEYIISKET